MRLGGWLRLGGIEGLREEREGMRNREGREKLGGGDEERGREADSDGSEREEI